MLFKRNKGFTGLDYFFLSFAFVGEVVRANRIGFPLNILSFIVINFKSLYDRSWFPVIWCSVSDNCVLT